jgi:hypothetical protein
MTEPVWRLDRSRSPMLIAQVVGGDGSTRPELTSVTSLLDELLTVGGPRVLVVDLTYAVPDAARRKLFIDWTKTHWATVRNDLLGVACVAPGAFQRSIITGLLWFIQPSNPVEIFDRRATALEWAAKLLADQGITVPSLRPPAAIG